MMHRSSTWGFRVRGAFLLGMGVPALLGAQGAALHYNALYACPDPLRLMVLSCTGAGDVELRGEDRGALRDDRLVRLVPDRLPVGEGDDDRHGEQRGGV